jgi:hypothetical protein
LLRRLVAASPETSNWNLLKAQDELGNACSGRLYRVGGYAIFIE